MANPPRNWDVFILEILSTASTVVVEGKPVARLHLSKTAFSKWKNALKAKL